MANAEPYDGNHRFLTTTTFIAFHSEEPVTTVTIPVKVGREVPTFK